MSFTIECRDNVEQEKKNFPDLCYKQLSIIKLYLHKKREINSTEKGKMRFLKNKERILKKKRKERKWGLFEAVLPNPNQEEDQNYFSFQLQTGLICDISTSSISHVLFLVIN